MFRWVLALFGALAIAVLADPRGAHAGGPPPTVHVTTETEAAAKGLALATFAGGCFWCVEADFRKVDGVVEVVTGFTGGRVADPSYDDVAWGRTGHVEAVQVTFDPKIVGYDYLVEYYWRHVDPTDGGGQFSDRGTAYRPAIFTHSEAQKAIAERSRSALAESKRFGSRIAVSIEPAGRFWPAEESHQNFAAKRPWWYRYYRHGSGRDTRLDAVWGSEARGPRPQRATH